MDDSLYKGPIYKLPLVPLLALRSPFWKIPISGFQLAYKNSTGATNIQQPKIIQYDFPSGAYGKIDSSSPVLTVPQDTADALNKALGAVFDPTTNLYIISCDALKTAPSIVIQFDGVGVNAHIPPNQYIYQKEDKTSGGCHTAIAGGSDKQNVYLGGPFFRSFYLVFHYSGFNVGIAESSVQDAGKLYS